jgi:hypothetical protein
MKKKLLIAMISIVFIQYLGKEEIL